MLSITRTGRLNVLLQKRFRSQTSILEPIVVHNHFDGETRKLFDREKIDIHAVNSFLNKELGNMTIGNMAYLLYSAAMKRVSLDGKYIWNINYALADSNQIVGKVEISRMLFGLRVLKPAKSTIALVDSLATVIQHRAPLRFDSRSLGMSLYGLQFLSSDISSVKIIISELNRRLSLCEEVFDPHTLSNSLRVLNFKKSDSDIVRELLSILYTKLISCEEEFDSTPFSRCVRCLCSLDTKTAEVRGIVGAMATKGATCRGSFSVENVIDILCGLQNMDTDYDEVAQLFAFVSNIIRTNQLELTPKSIGKILFFAKNFDGAKPPVANLFMQLSEQIKLFNGPFDSESLAFAMQGLQKCKINQPGIPEILGVLVSGASRIDGVICHRDLKMCFLGMSNMTANLNHVRNMLTILTGHLRRQNEKLTAESVLVILGSTKYMKSEFHEVRDLIAAVAEKVEKSNLILGDEKYFMLYNLRGMDSRSPEPVSLLRVLTPSLERPVSSVSGKYVGVALYGLRGMSSALPEVRRVIQILFEEWRLQSIRLDGQAIGNAVYGLQRMDCDCEEVRNIVTLLADMITRSSGTARLNPLAAAMAVYGLKSMEGSHREVRHLIHALTPLIRQCAYTFNSVNISNLLYGMRRMSSDYEEVRNLLEVMAVKIDGCKSMRMMHVSFALHGMKQMDSTHGAVRDVLGALKRQMDLALEAPHYQDGLTIAFLVKAVVGLNRMNDESAIVREVIGAIARAYLNPTNHKMSPQEFCMFMFGLRQMSLDTPEVSLLVNRLVVDLPHVQVFNPLQMAQVFEGMKNMNVDNNESARKIVAFMTSVLNISGGMTINAKDIVSCIVGLQTVCRSSSKEAKSFIVALTNYLRSCEFSLTSMDIKQCNFFVSSASKDNEVEIRDLLSVIDEHNQYVLNRVKKSD